MMCEKCWGDAYARSQLRIVGQAEAYSELVAERDCTPKQQAGQYWDEETQRDSRLPVEESP